MSDYGYPQQPPGYPQQQQAYPPPGAKLMVGDLLQSSANIVGANFAVFLIVAVAFSIPGLVLGALAPQPNQLELQAQMQSITSPAQIFDLIPWTTILVAIIAGLVSFVLIYVAMGTLMYASVEHMAGRQVTVGEAISRGLSAAPSVIGVAFLVAILEFFAMVPGMVALMGGTVGMAVAMGSSGGPEIGLICCCIPVGLPLVLAPVFYLTILFFIAIPAAVVEKIDPITAMKRSVNLTKGHRMTIFLTLLVVILCFVLLVLIAGCCVGGMGASTMDLQTMTAQEPSIFVQILGFVINLFVSTLRIMVLSALAAVIYARIRGLRDNVDAAALAQVFS